MASRRPTEPRLRPAVGSVTSGALRPLAECDIAAGVLPRLRAVVEARADHTAVDDGTHRLTYGRLARRAAALRADLDGRFAAQGDRGHGAAGENPEPVAVLAGHDVTAIVAIVAVLASGHPVVVLDRRTPPMWQRRLVGQVGAQVVVADGADPEALAAAKDLAGDPASVIGIEASTERDAADLWRAGPAPDAPAVIAFTSGTTGVTKPVVSAHRLLVRDAWNSSVATCCYDDRDVLVHTLPLPFHAGLTTAIHALLVGCGIRLVDVRRDGVSPLPQAVADAGGTLLVTSPAILRGLAAADPDPALLAGLHGVTVAGESIYGRDIAAVMPVLGSRCVVRNRYGASEVGLIAESVIGRDVPDGRLPVGRGVGWTRVDVVREDGTPADIDERGTITVTAPDLALGYAGRPDDPAFVGNPDGTRTFRTSDLGRRLPDGSIDLTGRSDHAVTIRGYLVDPGEVEAVALALPGVRECLVVGQERETGSRLVAFVVGEAASDPAAVRARLRERLPAHMVPAEVLPLTALPRTERGKVDRDALPLPQRPQAHAPLTHWEQLVGDAWTAVLGADDLGPDDDFFTLGGDSLAAEELMTRLRDDLGVAPERASSRVLVQTPTLRDFAAAVHPERRRGGVLRQGDRLVALHAAGDRPPLFLVVGAGGLGRTLGPLARRLGADQPVYALQSPSVEGRALPEGSVAAIARAHLAAIRTVTGGPILLAGHGFGGIVALEIARQVETGSSTGDTTGTVDHADDTAVTGTRESTDERDRPVDQDGHADERGGSSARVVALLEVTPPALVRGDERSALRRAKSGLGLLRAALGDTAGGAQAWRWQLQADDLTARYAPPRREEPVLVLTASESPSATAQASWREHLPHMVQRHVPGGSLTMLRPPHVDAVAGHLRQALSEAMAQAMTEVRTDRPATEQEASRA